MFDALFQPFHMVSRSNTVSEPLMPSTPCAKPVVAVIPLLIDMLPSGLGCCMVEGIRGGMDAMGVSAEGTKTLSSLLKVDVVTVGMTSRSVDRKKWFTGSKLLQWEGVASVGVLRPGKCNLVAVEGRSSFALSKLSTM